MGQSPFDARAFDGLERIRSQLLTSLHLGKLGPGDRVPSVRGMARITGLNRKTVHRAYLKLAREGLLNLKWGSGTYLADELAEPGSDAPSLHALMRLFERFGDEADSIGLSRADLPRFLSVMAGDEIDETPLAVVECNGEQTGLIARELSRHAHRRLREVPLENLRVQAERLLDQAFGVVTTDCHRDEVEDIVGSIGMPVYRIALDPSLPEEISYRARHGAVLMIVRDRAFEPVFKRLLEQLGVTEDARGRIRVVEGPEALGLLPVWPDEGSVYVSPLVENELIDEAAAGARRIRPRSYVDEKSAEALRVRLALDLMRAGRGDA